MRSVLFSSTLLASTLSSLPLFADVTPEDVWEAYRQSMINSGMEVTADVSREGDTLVVRNMIYGLDMGGDTVNVTSTSTAPEVRFQERSGGKVASWFTAPITTLTTMPLDPALGDNETIETRMTMAINGETLVEGTADDMLLSFDDLQVSMSGDPVYQDDILVQPGLDMSVEGIGGTYTLTTENDAMSSVMDMTAALLRYDIEMDDPSAGAMTMQMRTEDLAMEGTMDVPNAEEGRPFAETFAAFVLDATATSAQSSFEMRMDVPESGPVAVSMQSGASELGISMNAGLVGYDIETNDIGVVAQGQVIPGGQLRLSMARATENLLLPLGASDADQPFKIAFGLEELVLPDLVWMIADPEGQLPHDPANLRLAFEGTVQSDLNLFDFQALEALDAGEAKMPIQVKTLALPELYLSLAGASIAGTGAGRFLEAEPAMPGGLPPFAGSLSLDINGLQDLLDHFASRGILPPEQVMSVQMMLGLFARPGENAGQLVSTIEMQEDGTILANGQPLPF